MLFLVGRNRSGARIRAVQTSQLRRLLFHACADIEDTAHRQKYAATSREIQRDIGVQLTEWRPREVRVAKKDMMALLGVHFQELSRY